MIPGDDVRESAAGPSGENAMMRCGQLSMQKIVRTNQCRCSREAMRPPRGRRVAQARPVEASCMSPLSQREMQSIDLLLDG